MKEWAKALAFVVFFPVLVVWFLWRGDKTVEELPWWYNKLNLP